MNYFCIYGDGHPHHPLLDWEAGSQFFRRCQPAKLRAGFAYAVRIVQPIPDTIALPDYLGLPRPVVSTRVRAAIEAIGVRTVEFVPVALHLPDGDIVPDRYHFMHIAFKAEIADLEKSKCSLGHDGNILAFDRIVLSEEKLSRIDPLDRKIFCMAEQRSLRFYNQEIIDALADIGATGYRSVALTDFGPGSVFAGD